MVATSACLFGAIPIFTLIATRAGVPLQAFLVGRYAIGGFAQLIALGGRPRAPRDNALRLVAIGGVGQVLVTWFGLSALRYVPAATAGFLFYTYPAWITVWAALRRTEPMTPQRVVALGLALGGVAVMAAPQVGTESTIAWPGIALALAASVVYACYVPMMRKAQTGVSPMVSSVLVSLAAAALYLIVCLITGGFVRPTDPASALSAIAGVGLISTFVAFVLFFRGLDALGPVRTSIISTVEPFCTAILAALFMGQPLTAAAIAGGLLIAAAVALLQSEAVSQ